MKKRLTLTEKSTETIAQGVRSIAELPDQVGVIVKMWKQLNLTALLKKTLRQSAKRAFLLSKQ